MIFFISILLSTVLHWTELATRPVNAPIKGEPHMEIVLLGENSNKTYFELDSSKYVPFKSHNYFFQFFRNNSFLKWTFLSSFGVCCVFSISSSNGGSVSQNNTYIQNPNYPSVFTSTSAISYTVNKVSSGLKKIELK